jgi:hypothetical protein
VPCSHKNVIAVSMPSSVGSVPVRLFSFATLKMPRSTTQTTTAHLRWRERVSTGAVLSHCIQQRHQAQLCRQRASQAVLLHPAEEATQHHSDKHSTSQVKGARVNGCRALTVSSFVSSGPAL